MKIRAERTTLADSLTWVAQAIPKKPQMPVLAGMRLAAAGDTLTLSGFDYDISHVARLDVDVVTEGECLVSGHFLREIVSILKGADVELTLDGDQLTVAAGRSTYRTQVLRLDDYPTLPKQPTTVGTIDAAALIHAVATCRTPVDDMAPTEAVRGLHLEGNQDDLVVVGMRSAIGIEVTRPWACTQPFEATAPVKVVDPAVRGLRGLVSIAHNEGLLGFADEHRSVTIRCFAYKFANWRAVLRDPELDNFGSVVDVDDLIEVVRRAGTLADDTTPLAITFADGEITVEVASPERGGGTEVVVAENGGTGSMGMHPRYLLEALGAMPAGSVRLGVGALGARTQAVIVRPLDATDAVSMVMPKKLPGGAR